MFECALAAIGRAGYRLRDADGEASSSPDEQRGTGTRSCRCWGAEFGEKLIGLASPEQLDQNRRAAAGRGGPRDVDRLARAEGGPVERAIDRERARRVHAEAGGRDVARTGREIRDADRVATRSVARLGLSR